ncbi:hypothetical protein GCM10009416_37570 [Craurococcus roseus]|uniref:histidine kinase n=2 Tax=Craurococcus roseus TaxID=77585 RepID=A0ABN1FQR9_9PROT
MGGTGFLAGGGEMGALMRRHDWSASPIGRPETWPQSLRSVVGLLLESKFPMFVAWGPELAFLYNDGYRPIFGAKHPRALGLPFREVWPEIWADIEPLVSKALAGEATFHENLHLVMERNGYPEDTWYTFSYSPVRDESGAVAGMFCACTETTGQVFAERRLRESEEDYRYASDLSPQTVWTARPDGQLDRVGSRWGEWTGTSGLGSSWGDALHPDDLARSVEAWTRSVTTGEPYDIQHRARLRDGSYRWMHSRAFPRCDEAGAIVRWYGTTQDIHAAWTAEEALRESEARFRNMADHAPVMMWGTDPDGYCTWLNRRWYEFTGQVEAEALGLGWAKATHPDDQKAAEEAFLAANAAQGPFRVEYRLRRADGVYRWAIDAASPRFGPDGGFLGYIGSVIDIGDRREAEDALREGNERLTLATEATGVGIWDYDLVSGALRWDDRCKALFGLPPSAEVDYGTFLAGLHPDDRGTTDAAVQRALAPDGPGEYDIEYRTVGLEDRMERWIAAKGRAFFEGQGAARRAVRFVGTVRDIGERKAAVQALRESETRLRGVLEGMNEGFVLLDRGFRVLAINPAGLRFEGREAAAILGKTHWEAWPGTEDAEQGRLYKRAMAEQVPVAADVEYAWPDGRGRWFEVRAYPVPEGLAVFYRDVTERKRTEARRLALAELGDRVRDIEDPAELSFAAAEILGRTLGVSRAGYGTIDTAAETITIERDWNAPGIKSLAGVLRFRDYGSYIEDLKRGETAIVADAEKDPRTAATAEALKAISAQAFINMPVTEQGGIVALLYLNHATAREWPPEELAFVREAAGRTRTAVERRRAEQALRHSEAEARRLAAQQSATLGQLAEGVIVTDAAGRITLINEAAGRLHGARRLDVAPDAYSETYSLLTEDGRPYPSLDLPLARAVRGETVLEARWRIRRPDGGEVLAVGNARPVLDGAGRQIGAVLTIRDDTARRAAEEALERLNRSLEETVAARTRELDRVWRNSRDLLVVVGADGVFRAVNPAWAAILGHGPGEVVGRSFLDFVWPEDAGPTRDALDAAASAGDLTDFENRYTHKDGTPRWISWRTSLEGDLVYAYGRDVTAEKEQADALRRAEEQLRQSQKMEAVGQLTGGIAHDFNNLLTGIAGSLEMLNARISQGRIMEVDRYVTAAQGAAKRAAALTHRLLAFSRRQTLDPKPIDLNRLVAGMEELVRRTVGPAVAVEVVAAGGLWTTLADPNQLENALLNLCINARDAMPDGGKLTIETANKWLDARAARERDLPPGQYVSLCVSDTGIGMTPDVARRAFDPFFTTKPIGMGTGLGLSMIYGFVRQSGGQARIYSEPGKGTLVCLYLPRHQGGGADEGAEPAAEAPKPRAGRGETVLVVDDEPTVRMLIGEVLEDLGYTAIEAADGASGLKALRSADRIDLLVTDVGLPGGMNGRQLADAAREARPGLKVLFITGYAENAVLNHGHLDPGMHVLTKPFSMEALASRIKDLIAGA